MLFDLGRGKRCPRHEKIKFLTGGTKVKTCDKVHSLKNIYQILTVLTMSETFPRPARAEDVPSSFLAISYLIGTGLGIDMTDIEIIPK